MSIGRICCRPEHVKSRYHYNLTISWMKPNLIISTRTRSSQFLQTRENTWKIIITHLKTHIFELFISKFSLDEVILNPRTADEHFIHPLDRSKVTLFSNTGKKLDRSFCSTILFQTPLGVIPWVIFSQSHNVSRTKLRGFLNDEINGDWSQRAPDLLRYH